MRKKIFKMVLPLIAVVLVSSVLPSCSNDDNYGDLYPNALVTVKNNADKSIYLQLDEKTTLNPTNMKTSPFNGKEVRALVNYRELGTSGNANVKEVYVNWIDSILTKQTVPDLKELNDKTYGNDAVEIINDWVTIAEDGYLTLRFRTEWGQSSKPHFVNLLIGGNPDNPYEIEFRHDANGDAGYTIGDALVAFKLDKLPDTNGKTVKLKLKWKSFSGEKTHEFSYCTNKGDEAKSWKGEAKFVSTVE